jgi:hypothetical protein
MIQIWNDRNPQGFSYRVHGVPSREFLDLEGMALVRIKSKGGKGRKKG